MGVVGKVGGVTWVWRARWEGSHGCGEKCGRGHMGVVRNVGGVTWVWWARWEGSR